MCVPAILSSWFSTSWGVNQCSYFFLICSDLSHFFSDATGFLLFPGLASEAQEAQVARLFLFSCREALFSPDIPDLFSFCFLLLFPFLTYLRMQFGATCVLDFCLSFHCTFPFFLVFLMNSQIAINRKQIVQETDQQPALRQGMVDADPEASPSTQVRLASSFYSLSILGGDLYFIYFPSEYIPNN